MKLRQAKKIIKLKHQNRHNIDQCKRAFVVADRHRWWYWPPEKLIKSKYSFREWVDAVTTEAIETRYEEFQKEMIDRVYRSLIVPKNVLLGTDQS